VHIIGTIQHQAIVNEQLSILLKLTARQISQLRCHLFKGKRTKKQENGVKAKYINNNDNNKILIYNAPDSVDSEAGKLLRIITVQVVH